MLATTFHPHPPRGPLMTHALLRPFCLLALSLPALAFAQASTLDKIKQSGTMTLAYRESSIPFSYLGGDAQPTGFGFEICEKIVDRVKAGDRPQRPQEAVPGGDLGQPHPAAAERHDRHRVRLDHQQQRARQAGRLRDQLLLHRHALPGEDRHQRQQAAAISPASRSSRPPARPTSRSSASSTRTRSSASTCSARRTTPSRR